MARGGRIQFTVDHRKFQQQLQMGIERVERGTKKATWAALNELAEMTLNEVPFKSGALFDSFFMDVEGSYKNFTGTLGYGGNEVYNAQTGQSVGQYMVAVHEDLDAVHLTGKAKYLEDPIREYERKFIQTAGRVIRNEIR